MLPPKPLPILYTSFMNLNIITSYGMLYTPCLLWMSTFFFRLKQYYIYNLYILLSQIQRQQMFQYFGSIQNCISLNKNSSLLRNFDGYLFCNKQPNTDIYPEATTYSDNISNVYLPTVKLLTQTSHYKFKDLYLTLTFVIFMKSAMRERSV